VAPVSFPFVFNGQERRLEFFVEARGSQIGQGDKFCQFQKGFETSRVIQEVRSVGSEKKKSSELALAAFWSV
jgi:hypothetical protein